MRSLTDDELRRDLDNGLVLTQKALLRRLHERGIPLTAYRLRHWEAGGIVPRGVRLDELPGRPAIYPDWYVEVLADIVRFKQEPGQDLAAAASYARAIFSEGERGSRPPGASLGLPRAVEHALIALAAQQLEVVGAVEVRMLDPEGQEINACVLSLGGGGFAWATGQMLSGRRLNIRLL